MLTLILFILINILLAYIDQHHGLLPFGLCLVLTLMAAPYCDSHALLCRGLFLLIYLGGLQWAYQKIRGIDGLGDGDIALCLAYTTWFPLHNLLIIISLASAVALLLNRQTKAQTFPFGPYLCCAASFWLILATS